MTEIKSDFGKGLVICLVKFAEHFERDMIFLKIRDFENGNLTDLDKQILEIYGSVEKLISHEIEMWANGASDHLYEIEVPKGKGWDKIRIKVKELQEKGLNMGHGFHLSKIWKKEDLFELFNLTRDIALMIDKKLGLNPDVGEW